MDVLSAFLLAASLCADCFAVTACSSVSLRKTEWKNIWPAAFSFAVIQTLFMFAGWWLGDLFVGAVEKIADVIGFLLLLYVGGSMILESVRGKTEERNLDGWRNIIIGGIATSIDALAVGVSLSMDRTATGKVAADLVAVFIVTALSVIAGIAGGAGIGRKVGRPAEIVGGTVLILIGLNILTDII